MDLLTQICNHVRKTLNFTRQLDCSSAASNNVYNLLLLLKQQNLFSLLSPDFWRTCWVSATHYDSFGSFVYILRVQKRSAYSLDTIFFDLYLASIKTHTTPCVNQIFLNLSTENFKFFKFID